MAVVLLAFVVLVLTFLVAALYRQVALVAEGVSPSQRWPLDGATPGQALPSHPMLSADYSGFVAILDGRHDGFAAVAAATALAHGWQTPLIVIGTDLEAASWLEDLPSLPEVVTAASGEFMHRLRPRSLPAVVHLRDGRVTEAAATGWSPSELAERFRLTAGPLFTAVT
jgi:hypothetical protein